MSAEQRSDDELLAAYCDGISELSPDERRRVEAVLATQPGAREDERATRALLGQLRDLDPSPAGSEPDWTAMERAIHAEVGAEAPRRRWWTSWRTWRWAIPAGATAVALAITMLVLRTPEPAAPTTPPRAELPSVATSLAVPAATQAADPQLVPLWLDGAEVEVDLALGPDALLGLDEGDDDALEAEGDLASVGEGETLLPSGGLAWVDALGDDDMRAAEAWLARKKS